MSDEWSSYLNDGAEPEKVKQLIEDWETRMGEDYDTLFWAEDEAWKVVLTKILGIEMARENSD